MIMYVIPVTTYTMERSFSQMKIVKTIGDKNWHEGLKCTRLQTYGEASPPLSLSLFTLSLDETLAFNGIAREYVLL